MSSTKIPEDEFSTETYTILYGHCNDVDHSFLRSQKLLLHGTALLVDDIQGCKMWHETQMVR